MVNDIPRFLILFSCNVFKDLWGGPKKKTLKKRVLVLNLAEVIFIDLKITETRFITIQSPFVTFE